MGTAESLAVGGVIVAGIIDFGMHRVPNWLTVPLAIAGLILAGWHGGVSGLVPACAGLLLALGLFIGPFAMGWMGGGDVKLFMALGSLLGWYGLLWATLYSALAGGVLALGRLVYRQIQAAEFRRQWQATLLGFILLAGSPTRRNTGLPLFPGTAAALRERYPYALAIAAGTLVAVFLHPNI